MSSDLQWLLLRNSNAFLVKRVPEGPILSKEPGNLTNLHSFKYSGLANEKLPQTIVVKDTESGIQLLTRKKGASPRAVNPAFTTTTIRPRSGPRRAAGVTAKLAKRGYRPDLRAHQLEPAGAPQGITQQ
ncbi:ribosomal protein L28e [Polyporus arcularius HHB13444]|uniref:Ribosomal protein L28e n=1 Tax=Polyporus arcularius HHB13444 TaxID=1314778 RepID=A0A5C3PKL4_9APHY|nr:ribosomal protein L28e [Polyporus arcularius HHB13444]